LIAAAILAAMDLETSGTTEEPRGIGARKLISTRSAISLAALFFLYIGSENSVAGWVASLTRRMSSVTGDSWTLAPMFFWAGLFMGRGLLPLIPLRRSERKLLQSGLLLTSVAIVVLLSATSFAMVAASVTASGLGMAAIFPLLVAWLVKALGERSRQSGWIMFALASMGGATMPWFVGATSSRLGSLRAGLLIPLAGCAVMFTLIAMMTEPIFRETDELNAPVTLLPDKSS
jgi:FHS family glucose/mannose:H+ symporter-like MFS transporter